MKKKLGVPSPKVSSLDKAICLAEIFNDALCQAIYWLAYEPDSRKAEIVELSVAALESSFDMRMPKCNHKKGKSCGKKKSKKLEKA